jgi:transcriptional regulator with XRE-family HTH domain
VDFGMTSGDAALMLDRSDRWPEVGAWIKASYTSRGYSQTQFAEKIDISSNTLRSIERGRAPRLAVIARIEAALGWDPGTVQGLLDGDIDEPPPPTSSGSSDERIERLEAKVDHLTDLLMAALSGDTSQPFVEGAPVKRQHGGVPEPYDPDEA